MLCGPGRVCRCVVEERLGRSPESSHPPGPAYPGHRQARGSGRHQGMLLASDECLLI